MTGNELAGVRSLIRTESVKETPDGKYIRKLIKVIKRDDRQRAYTPPGSEPFRTYSWEGRAFGCEPGLWEDPDEKIQFEPLRMAVM